jgi:hypothetical protein
MGERIEEGWPITVRTMCRVGNHVWIWTSCGETSETPPTDTRCDCGALTWEDTCREARDG